MLHLKKRTVVLIGHDFLKSKLSGPRASLVLVK